MSNAERFELCLEENAEIKDALCQGLIILYSIRGETVVRQLSKEYRMHEEDLLVINNNRIYSIKNDVNALLCLFHITGAEMQHILKSGLYSFSCNSMENDSDKYDILRRIIGDLLGEYSKDMDSLSCMKLSNYYKLLHYLVRYFSTSLEELSSAAHTNQRGTAILQFLYENSRNKISLSEISSRFYMSPASFSRYFRKAFGLSFVEYINTIRLQNAEDDLRFSSKTISQAALDNGFSNISAFSKAFKTKYGLSPSRYKTDSLSHKSISSAVSLHKSNDFQQELEIFQKKTKFVTGEERKIKLLEVQADTRSFKKRDCCFTYALSLGHAAALLSADYHAQIQQAKKYLNFQYGRIWGIFAKELELINPDAHSDLNFQKFDRLLDFLIKEGITPFISLDTRLETLQLRFDFDVHVLGKERNGKISFSPFKNRIECLYTIKQLIGHILSRFGRAAAGQWIFELWYNETDETVLGVHDPYFHIFSDVCKIIKSALPEAKVGGCGLSPSINEKKFRNLFMTWPADSERPDFISIFAYPYYLSTFHDVTYSTRKRNADFLNEEILRCHSVLNEYGFGNIPIIVSEWNPSLSRRNYFNDSCAKASQMLRLMSGLHEKTEMCIYCNLSDLYSDSYDTKLVLNGSYGLISSAGICKPAFYALKFMGNLYPFLIKSGDGYLLTKDADENYAILLYNCKDFGYEYYSRKEKSISIEDLSHIFIDFDEFEITVCLQNIRPGNYLLQKQDLSPEHGSILEAWQSMGTTPYPDAESIDYLERISVPLRQNEQICSTGSTIKIKQKLAVHEFLLIKITYQYFSE